MVLNKQEQDRLPATLKRSPKKAQATYMHTLEAAEETHGDGEAAHRIAFGSLKHSFEKVGDHWEPKEERGPSDEQDAKRGASALRSTAKTAGGVNAYATKAHLMEIARRLNVTGRSTMTKAELVAAIEKANRTASASMNRKARPQTDTLS
jgi:ChaB/Rho termination factor, N-terminal domain